MKILKLCFAIVLMSGAGFVYADPPSQVGRLNYLSGTVSFAPADASNEWEVAPLNRPITSGDRLWADQDGRAEMRIGSTAIRIAALTSVDVLSLDEDVTQLRLAQGTLNVRLRQLEAGDSFEISTPAGAVLLVQPGNYRVNVDPSGATTTVLVRRGQADVLTITGNAPLTVRDDQLVALSARTQEMFAAPAPDEFDNWAAARDGEEERVVATRYVPPAMTGYEDLDRYGTWNSVPEYGAVWIPTTVVAGWAPYRDGRWVWISPWGWTWVDSAPWGFAPYHYGRWVWLGNRWAWAPGTRIARPVYAPALVAFIGGSNWSVSISSGPAVGWVPLGWREPYIPWYTHSPAYVRNVNITHVTNINVINRYSNVNNVRTVRYVNRDVPSATTVVTRETFVSARRVREAQLNVPVQVLATVRATHEAPVTRPERQSFAVSRPAMRLPAAVEAREVVAARAPVAPARFANDGASANERRAASDERGDQPRVRVLSAQQGASAPAAQRTATLPQPSVQTERIERAAERNPAPARPPVESRPNAVPARPQAEVQRQQQPPQPPQQRQSQQEQRQQARAQARIAQQQNAPEQKVQQQPVQQQRVQEAPQPRERRSSQAQQAQPQTQSRPQREKRQAEPVEKQQQSSARAAQSPPPDKEKRVRESERTQQQR